MNITVYTSLASVLIAILSFSWTLYKDLIRDKKKESPETTQTQKTVDSPKINKPTEANGSSNSPAIHNSWIYNIFKNIDSRLFALIFLFCIVIVIKFYLDYRSEIIFGITVLGALCLLVSIICVQDLRKNKLISSSTSYIEIIKWIPLFVGIVFAYTPLYNSGTLDTVIALLKNKSNFLLLFFKYPSDISFLTFQILGLFFTIVFLITSLLITLRTTHMALRNNDPIKNKSFGDVAFFLFIALFLSTFVSGLYVKFNYMF